MKLAIIQAAVLAAMFLIAAAVSYHSGYVGGRIDGATETEVARIVWGTTRDRRTWAGFCRYGNCDDIIERAHLYASMFEQGEIKNPITSLQSWLNETYPETAAYLVYRASRRNGSAK